MVEILRKKNASCTFSQDSRGMSLSSPLILSTYTHLKLLRLAKGMFSARSLRVPSNTLLLYWSGPIVFIQSYAGSALFSFEHACREWNPGLPCLHHNVGLLSSTKDMSSPTDDAMMSNCRAWQRTCPVPAPTGYHMTYIAPTTRHEG